MDEDLLLTEFGARLRHRRDADGVSQERLADLAGLSRTSIVNIEKGRQGVSLPTLYRLAVALSCDVCALLPPVGEWVRPTVPVAIGGGDADSALVERVLERAARDAG